MRAGSIVLWVGWAFLGAALPGHAEPGAPEVRTYLESGPSERRVDVVFVGDGYQAKHLAPNGKYWTDVKRYARRFLEEPPFAWYRSSFNVRAVFLVSADEGCEQDSKADRVHTALDCAFDAPKGRHLEFRDEAALDRALGSAGEVDIAFVVVNTERYGGSGTTLSKRRVRGRPLPAPTFSAQDTTSFLIAIHELGHSLADLADEYVDLDAQAEHPLPKDGVDLDEPNVQRSETLDASSFETLRKTAKWGHFLDLPGAKAHKWLHTGGDYRALGVVRPWSACRMRELADPFCPVCCEAIARTIVSRTGAEWDDAAYHKAHPLTLWKE